MISSSRVLFFDIYPFVLSFCPSNYTLYKISSLNKRRWQYQVAHKKVARINNLQESIRTGKIYIFCAVSRKHVYFINLNSCLLLSANYGSRAMCYYFLRVGAYDIYLALKTAELVGHKHVYRFLVNFLKRQKKF